MAFLSSSLSVLGDAAIASSSGGVLPGVGDRLVGGKSRAIVAQASGV